ncbi:MAG TPA: MFS transporter [Sphingobium sp.]|uniref:MFS transporter n=1 Tax=Sphingobium sp. TaxID=1912891 RepID=UPI002ED0674C
MGYAKEFRVNWRALAGATLGLGSGLSINGYVHSILGPYLLKEFGWTKAEFALIGTIYILGMISIPLSGRLADVVGARAAILFGVVLYPFSWIALSFMGNDIRLYYAINIFQLLLCSTTTTTVYSRVVAERFESARGIGLGIMACGPAIAGAVGSPILAEYVAAHGWRAGAVAFGIFTVLAGIAALLLIPPLLRPKEGTAPHRKAGADYRQILRNPVFWLVFVSVFLCCLPYALAQSQLNVMLLEKHLSPTAAGFVISTFAVGVMAGRFALGAALDRFPTHWVAFVGMALSGVGLFILASPVTHVAPLLVGVALFGISFGAESDIMGYAVARYFGMSNYSSVLGLLMAAAGAAMTTGSILLSATLARTDSFSPFMIVAGISVLCGATLLLRLKNIKPPENGVEMGMTGDLREASA